MTPRVAIELLMRYAREPNADAALQEAVGVVRDHVVQLEQCIELIDGGLTSALRHKPPNAVLKVK